jgi:uncharacterized membrane protein
MLADGITVDLTLNITQIVGRRRSLTDGGVRAGVRDISAVRKLYEKRVNALQFESERAH